MTVDIEKLEALAKGCRDEVIRSHGWAGMIDDADLLHRGGEFLKECSPDAVLELTQTIRDLQSSVSSLKTGYEAYERVNAELNQRIANLELCQTASLGVSGIIKSAASALGFDAAGEDSALDYLIGLARKAGALRAECEELRAQKIHWVTHPGNGLIRCVSDDRFQKFSPSIRARYEPIIAKEDESLRKDAERYRFLRSDLSEGKVDFCIVRKHWGADSLSAILELMAADEEIDVAMSKEAAQ